MVRKNQAPMEVKETKTFWWKGTKTRNTRKISSGDIPNSRDPPPPVLLRIKAQSRPDRGPTAQSGPRWPDGTIGAQSGPDGAISPIGDGAIGARSRPDGAIGARSKPDGAIGARSGPTAKIGAPRETTPDHPPRTTPQPSQNLVEPWWNRGTLPQTIPDHPAALVEPGGTLVEPSCNLTSNHPGPPRSPRRTWWNSGGTLVEPSWNLTSGPPRTTPEPIWAQTPKLSAVGEKKKSLKTRGLIKKGQKTGKTRKPKKHKKPKSQKAKKPGSSRSRVTSIICLLDPVFSLIVSGFFWFGALLHEDLV